MPIDCVELEVDREVGPESTPIRDATVTVSGRNGAMNFVLTLSLDSATVLADVLLNATSETVHNRSARFQVRHAQLEVSHERPSTIL
jgi:hypothetical protein